MRIAVVCNNLHIGGVQKALCSMLHSLSLKNDVTLFVFCKKGEYLENIPENVKVIEPDSAYKYIGATKYDVISPVSKLLRAFFATVTKLFGRKYAIWLMGLTQKKIEDFDIAISYLHSPSDKVFYGGCNEFTLKHIKADKKITFLHCDFEKIGANTNYNKKIYSQFDKIAACSKGCLESFVSAFPDLSDKCLVSENFHDFEQIKKLSDEFSPDLPEDKINILSVARLGREKGIDRAALAISNLPENIRNKIRYHIVGDGIEREKIKDIIIKNNLENTVIMYGEKQNPYPFMKNADLLLIPSVSEAAPLVIDECASLGTPVASTKTSSAIQMIQDRGFGFVCENSQKGIEQMLCDILSEPDVICKKSEFLKTHLFDNKNAIITLESLL